MELDKPFHFIVKLCTTMNPRERGLQTRLTGREAETKLVKGRQMVDANASEPFVFSFVGDSNNSHPASHRYLM